MTHISELVGPTDARADELIAKLRELGAVLSEEAVLEIRLSLWQTHGAAFDLGFRVQTEARGRAAR